MAREEVDDLQVAVATDAEDDGVSRRSFLRTAGIGTGVLIAAAAVPSLAFGKGGAANSHLAALASVPKSDIAILNYALTLEYLEAAFYTEAEQKGMLTGELANFAMIVGDHEREHVAFLKSALKSKAVKSPTFDFKDTTSDPAKFAATAQVLEDTGVSAYLGQVKRIKTKAYLGAAGSIMTVEARHAGWIRNINGVPGAPTAFDVPKTMKQILAAVAGTGFIVG